MLVQHKPVKRFRTGVPLTVEASLPSSTSGKLSLCYRRVNQAEKWVTIPMESNASAGGSFQASIPAAYTASPYPLQYYFEARLDSGGATIFSGAFAGLFHAALLPHSKRLAGDGNAPTFSVMARYNSAANERLYGKCAELTDREYRKRREGSFGSIHGLLNHILLGDRTWMARFEGGGHETPPLNTVLVEDFALLRAARAAEDLRIESFFGNLRADLDGLSFRYINNQGKEYLEAARVAFSHFFNHQTHHRGQIHVMLEPDNSKTAVTRSARIVNP